VLYRHFTGGAWQDVTVDEIARQIGRWQAAFRREGIRPGERIALCARNGINWVAIDMASLGLGLVVVPLYVDDNPDNIAWCVDHAKARLLIVESSRIAASLGGLTNAAQQLPPMVVLNPDERERGAPRARFSRKSARNGASDLPEDTLATICFTSGTSGVEGVMLSHGNILANVQGAGDGNGAA
jgi:long-chain acyl-CoA synthetase